LILFKADGFNAVGFSVF